MNDLERVGRHIVRTFYDPTPTNDDDAPIWCLGERYDPRPSPSSVVTRRDRLNGSEDDSWIRASLEESDETRPAATPKDPSAESVYGGWPQPFLDDFESRIWMTYRSGFAAIPKSQDPKATSAMSFRVRLQNLSQTAFTSDSGFGCMIRSGQCILANALASLRLGRGTPCSHLPSGIGADGLLDWRVGQSSQKDERPILSLFADDPRAPFSIHRFVQHGAAVCGKYPGEWFGPSATARCIQ